MPSKFKFELRDGSETTAVQWLDYWSEEWSRKHPETYKKQVYEYLLKRASRMAAKDLEILGAWKDDALKKPDDAKEAGIDPERVIFQWQMDAQSSQCRVSDLDRGCPKTWWNNGRWFPIEPSQVPEGMVRKEILPAGQEGDNNEAFRTRARDYPAPFRQWRALPNLRLKGTTIAQETNRDCCGVHG